MNAKKFLVSGVVGGIANFFLGWLIFGILFESQFPVQEGEVMNLTMIALGCLIAGLFIAYIFTKWAHISNGKTGLKAGAIIGLFLALYYDFYDNATNTIDAIDWQTMRLDVVLTIVMTALTGAIIAVVIGKIE
jgi:phage shock protein PspC (stress-responsive transcriptional regulator)